MTFAPRLVLLLPILAACAAVAAPAGAASAARPPAACSLLKPAEIAAALHVTVGKCAEGDLGPQHGGTWRTPNGEQAVLQLSVAAQNAAQQFSAFTGLAKGVKVKGVGDKAFYETARTTFYVLTHNVYVQMSMPPKTSLVAATKLAKIVAGRLK